MARQDWVNLLNYGPPWQTTAGTSLATAATATISPQAPGPQDFVLPGQDSGLQWYQGMSLEIEARGTAASGGTTSSLTVFLAAGVSATLGTTLSTTSAIVLGAGSLSNLPWWLRAQIDCVGLRTDANPFLTTEGEFHLGMTSTGLTIATANTVTAKLPVTSVNGSVLSPYTAGTALGLRATLTAAFGSILCNRFLIKQIG